MLHTGKFGISGGKTFGNSTVSPARWAGTVINRFEESSIYLSSSNTLHSLINRKVIDIS